MGIYSDVDKIFHPEQKRLRQLNAYEIWAEKELRQLRKIAEAATKCVKNSAWAGICDEDIALEQALHEAGWLEKTKKGTQEDGR